MLNNRSLHSRDEVGRIKQSVELFLNRFRLAFDLRDFFLKLLHLSVLTLNLFIFCVHGRPHRFHLLLEAGLNFLSDSLLLCQGFCLKLTNLFGHNGFISFLFRTLSYLVSLSNFLETLLLLFHLLTSSLLSLLTHLSNSLLESRGCLSNLDESFVHLKPILSGFLAKVLSLGDRVLQKRDTCFAHRFRHLGRIFEARDGLFKLSSN
mmetsp:Transcript_34003/g.54741  ORF Transcript_34003/g.54741 Transcript_34003/m.54741 type:complete len:206 (+) Transcript_34003:1418-2035(+)